MKGAGAIEVTELRKIFHQTGTGEAVVAIERLDFVVPEGDMVAIVGQTGCGKSTFLNVLIGLERPTQGRIAVGGRAPYDDFDHFRGVQEDVGVLATVAEDDGPLGEGEDLSLIGAVDDREMLGHEQPPSRVAT